MGRESNHQITSPNAQVPTTNEAASVMEVFQARKVIRQSFPGYLGATEDLPMGFPDPRATVEFTGDGELPLGNRPTK